MLDRWIQAQTIGIAAYRLGQHRQDDGRLAPIADFLERALHSATQADAYFIRHLPPVILQLLCDMLDDNLGEDLALARPTWKNILDHQLGRIEGDNTRIAPLVGARILTHHILHSTTSPLGLIRLAKALFRNSKPRLGKNWGSFETSSTALDTLESALTVLRSQWHDKHDTVQRLHCMDALNSEFVEAYYWPHIENALYHQLFAWPLLVLKNNRGAVSLPVGVNIYFDHKNKPELKSNGSIITDGWEPSLAHAVHAAKELWRGKHGNHGDFRTLVKNCSVCFDITITERIVKHFPERFELYDASMGAYFSQAVLSRLLGHVVSSGSIVTGEVGKQRRDDEGNLICDFEFLWPDGVLDKLHYVFGTHLFERIVLPHLHALPPSEVDRMEQFVTRHESPSSEINYVKHLQHVADAFQIGGWRQFRYVRCPDIAWHIHPNGERLLPVESDAVQKLLEILKNNNSSVLELTTPFTPVELATALWHINVTLRNQISRDRPPMASWAFVRAITEEQDSRFWQVIWKVTGASQEAFDEFDRTDTLQDAVEHIATWLNSFTPPYSCQSHRSPDILVLLDADRFESSLERTKNVLARAHALDPLLLLLNKPDVLLRSFLAHFLGNTRIIVFRNTANSYQQANKPRWAENHKERDLLQTLSIFRAGFTQQMASLVWTKLFALTGSEVRDHLKEFVERGSVRYALGEYHLPSDSKWPNGAPTSAQELAKRHYAAGIAYAPYVVVGDVPSLAFDRAFAPENIHEASYHFHQAYEKLPKRDRDPFRSSVRTALNLVSRFAEYPGRYVVGKLLDGGLATKDAYEVVTERLYHRKQSKVPPHPENFHLALRAVDKHWCSKPGREDEQVLLREMKELFEDALLASVHPMWRGNGDQEMNYNLLKMVTQRCTFLLENKPSLPQPESTNEASELINRARSLLEANTDGSAARGQWYEAVGNSLPSHEQAKEWYVLGTRWTPGWHQLWIKYYGCYTLGEDEGKNIVLNTLTKENADEILHRALPGLKRDIRDFGVYNNRNNALKPWVKRRWEAGLTTFEKLYPKEPAVQRHFRQYWEELAGWVE